MSKSSMLGEDLAGIGSRLMGMVTPKSAPQASATAPQPQRPPAHRPVTTATRIAMEAAQRLDPLDGRRRRPLPTDTRQLNVSVDVETKELLLRISKGKRMSMIECIERAVRLLADEQGVA